MTWLFLLTWSGLLAAVLGLLLLRPNPGWSGALLQAGVALAITAFSAWGLVATTRGRGAGVEVASYTFEAGQGGVTIGTDPACDVVLMDPYAAPFHASARWVEGPAGAPGLAMRSLTRERRLERNGVDIDHPALVPGSVLHLDGQTLRVEAVGGLLPAVTVRGPDGVEVLAPPLARRIAAALPWIGRRVEAGVARLEPGFGARPLALDLPRGDRPVAEIALRGGQALLRFPTPEDRDAHPIRVQAPGDDQARRPGDAEATIVSGDVLTLGYSRYQVGLAGEGHVSLTATRSAARFAFPDDAEGLLLLGERDRPGAFPLGSPKPVPVLFSLAPDGSVTMAAADPGYGFTAEGAVTRLHPGGAERLATVRPGVSGLLQLQAPRSSVILRVRGPERPGPLIAGVDSTDGMGLRWRALLALGLVYVLGTLVLAAPFRVRRRGSGVDLYRVTLLTPQGGAFLHASMLAFGQGLAALCQLSVPGDPRLGSFVDKQALIGAVGLGAGFAVLILTARRRRREGTIHPFQWLERPLAGGGRSGWLAQPRVWWVWVAACALLLAQLPFGEQGVALPGLGSVQPVEATKTCLLVFLAFFTSRALDDKGFRLRGREEGAWQRWRYLAHAVPLLAIVLLCFGLDDISPILIFGMFLLLMYYLGLRRPSLAFWPPRRLLQNFVVELFLLIVVAPPLLVWAAVASGGTVSRRFLVWLDPFRHTGDAGQFVASLWNLSQAGLAGAGWGGRNGALPPAVQDDFALAMVTAHTGLLGLMLLVATYCVAVLAGLRAAAGIPQGRPDLPRDATGDRVQLLVVGATALLAIQVFIVLGSVTGWMPVMGQPLPWVAAGGSHLLLFCVPAVIFVVGGSRHVVLARGPR